MDQEELEDKTETDNITVLTERIKTDPILDSELFITFMDSKFKNVRSDFREVVNKVRIEEREEFKRNAKERMAPPSVYEEMR